MGSYSVRLLNMRRVFHKKEEESGIDLTPMLDVVFIMLIFFIVTADFVKESSIDVNRPSAKTAKKTKGLYTGGYP